MLTRLTLSQHMKDQCTKLARSAAVAERRLVGRRRQGIVTKNFALARGNRE
jgi:hypothetical protein